MSLNNISLPPQLVAELYQYTLVEVSAPPAPQAKPIPFLGKNEKNILILVNHTTATFLPDKELAFLTTVLSACGLGLSHIAVVNWTKTEQNSEALLQQLSPKEILFLEISPAVVDFPSEVVPYTVQKKDNVQFVTAPSLSEIEKTKQAKSQLWIALKRLFCL